MLVGENHFTQISCATLLSRSGFVINLALFTHIFRGHNNSHLVGVRVASDVINIVEFTHHLS